MRSISVFLLLGIFLFGAGKAADLLETCSQLSDNQEIDPGLLELCELQDAVIRLQAGLEALSNPGQAEVASPEKRKNEFIRFGKRKNEFIRFGKRKNEFIRFGKSMPGGLLLHTGIGKRKNEFIRFGKRKNEFIRFGKRKNEFIRFGKSSPPSFMLL